MWLSKEWRVSEGGTILVSMTLGLTLFGFARVLDMLGVLVERLGLSTLGVLHPFRCPRTAIPLAHLKRGP